MEREVRFYKGSEIDTKVIQRIKQIALKGYGKLIYERGFAMIDDVSQLSSKHDVDTEDEIVVLGEDWFLCYQIADDMVAFLDWASTDFNGSKFEQTIEMMKTFRIIFLQNTKKRFTAHMRHNTSWQFYYTLLKKGFVNEVENYLYVDTSLINSDNFPHLIEELLDKNEALKHPEYWQYCFHDITFTITDEFVKKYTSKVR